QVINHTVNLFANDVRFADHIDIRTQLLPGVAVRMDAALLRQVFLNLLLNAAEAIELKGEITITMHQPAAGSVTVEVRDTGCGIPPENIETIFDPFFTTKPKGTGLGLSIVHRILESSDGQLEVTSQPGQGTLFRLIMPAFSIENSRRKALS
ncbi:MAG: ATP-binding protein, partial [Desulfobacterales bacterium]